MDKKSEVFLGQKESVARYDLEKKTNLEPKNRRYPRDYYYL
jgi:hypothetical protein